MKTLHLFHRVVLTAAHQAGLLLAHEVETPGVDKPRSKSPAFYASNLFMLYSLVSKLVSISLVFYITPFPNLLLLRCVGIQMSLAEMHEVVEEAV